MEETSAPDDAERNPISPWRLTGWLCAGVISLSVLSCVVLAVVRSNGLTRVTVTALDEESEPRDHNLPLIKQKEALPDYELALILKNGETVHLGTKPDSSAVAGLVWQLNETVSVKDIASIRLQEQDKIVSDAIAEVQIGDNATTTENGYRFDFVSERSMSVGIGSFFGTPIGKAIAAGFCIAVILMVASRYCD